MRSGKLSIVLSVLGVGLVGVTMGSTALNIGPKECATGIDYWCQDLDSARACGAIHHCIQNVWQHAKYPRDSSALCDICKQMVVDARDELQSNQTEDEIKQVFERTCRTSFTIKPIANECVRIVDEYIPDFIEELASMMNPQTVCATAGMCNSFKFLEKLGIRKMIADSSACQECEDTAEVLIKRIQNMTDNQFESQLMKVCDASPGIREPCRMAVEMYAKDLHKKIDEAQPKEVCMLVGMCDGLPSQPKFKLILLDGTELSFKHEDKGAAECEVCKQIVKQVKDIITANSTEEEVKETLLFFCNHLGRFGKTCTNIINQYYKEIYDFIVNELDPENMCMIFGLCSSKPELPFMNLLPSKSAHSEVVMKNDIESNSIYWQPIQQAQHPQLPATRYIPQAFIPAITGTNKEKSAGKVSCALCEYALHELQAILGDQRTEQAIKNALNQLCERLPATLTKECEEYVRNYSDLIIALIEQEIDPSIMCVELGLCPPSSKLLASNMPSLKLQLPMSKPELSTSLEKTGAVGLNSCELCHRIVSILDSLLEDKPTEMDIVHAMENVCPLMPKEYYAKCVTLLEGYGPYILQYIGTMANSKLVCHSAGVCPSQSSSVQVLGGNKCTSGPSYWCKSIFHAKACYAEEHCRKNVWKN